MGEKNGGGVGFFPHATSFFPALPAPLRTGRVEGRGGGPKHLTILLRSRKEKKSKEREGGYGDSKGGVCGLLKVRKRDSFREMDAAWAAWPYALKVFVIKLE